MAPYASPSPPPPRTCMVIMCTVEERLHSTSWSWFWGNRCTLLMATSPVAVGYGGQGGRGEDER